MTRTVFVFLSLVVAAFLLGQSAFVVDEKTQVVVTEFGEPVGGSPEQFAAFLRSDSETNARTLKITGVRLD